MKSWGLYSRCGHIKHINIRYLPGLARCPGRPGGAGTLGQPEARSQGGHDGIVGGRRSSIDGCGVFSGEQLPSQLRPFPDLVSPSRPDP